MSSRIDGLREMTGALCFLTDALYSEISLICQRIYLSYFKDIFDAFFRCKVFGHGAKYLCPENEEVIKPQKTGISRSKILSG